MSLIQFSGPTFRALSDALRDLSQQGKYTVEPFRIHITNGRIFRDTDGVALRFIQNCSTDPLKYCIGNAADANTFHGILAGCTTQDDGLGSILDLSKFKGAVYVFSAGVVRACCFEALLPNQPAIG